jgi:hypothetical protein
MQFNPRAIAATFELPDYSTSTTMVLTHNSWFCAGMVALLIIGTARAQETAPDADEASRPTTYFDLRRSNDRTARLTAERYFTLVRLQEWSDVTGKSTVMAKYVEHDPELQWVKLEAVRVRDGKRQVGEVTVPVEKLSKTCQSRVKQIDILQKKLDELLAAAGEDENGVETGGHGFEDPGTPMVDERGAEPHGGQEVAAPAGESELGLPPQSAAQVNFEEEPFSPDPLGFAEMDLTPLPQGLPQQAGPLPPGLALPGGPAGGNVDRAEWATSYSAFVANFTVAQDDSGEVKIDWGELDELRAIGERLANQPVGIGTESPERLGEVHWEAGFGGISPGEGATRVAFDLPPLPPPLALEFRIEEAQGGGGMAEWEPLAGGAGNRIRFTGRLAMAGPTSIVVFVREPQPIPPEPGR